MGEHDLIPAQLLPELELSRALGIHSTTRSWCWDVVDEPGGSGMVPSGGSGTGCLCPSCYVHILLGSINTHPPAPDGSQSPARAPWQEQLLAQTLFSFLLHGISNFIKELIAVPTPALPTPPYRRAAPILGCETEHWAGQSQGIPWDQGSHSPRAATGASTMGNHPVVYRSPWAATPILLFPPSFQSH